MSSMIKDKQRAAFYSLLGDVLPKVIEESSFTVNDTFDVQFSMYPCDLENPYVNDVDTVFTIVKAKCEIQNLINKEKETLLFDILKIPVYQDLGFRIRGNNHQVLDSYNKASGWSFQPINSKGILEAKLSSIGGLRSVKKTMSFIENNGRIMFTLNKKSKRNEVKKVSAAVFFRAITGLTLEQLSEKFGTYNPYVQIAFSDSVEECNVNNRADCIKRLASLFIVDESKSQIKTLPDKLETIRKELFNLAYFDVGDSNIITLDRVQSFKHRALGKVLAEDITINGREYKEGTILSDSILEELDSLPIDKITVLYNDKYYDLLKFSFFKFRALDCTLDEDTEFAKKGTVINGDLLYRLNNSTLEELNVITYDGRKEKLTRRVSANQIEIEDLYTAFGIFLNNLNGFDTFDNQYEMTDRIVVPFDKKAKSLVEFNLRKVVSSLKERLSLLDSNEKKYDVLKNYTTRQIENDELSDEDREILELEEEKEKEEKNSFITPIDSSIINAVFDISNTVNTDLFLDSISTTGDPNTQMSDINNIMAYEEKNLKISSNITDKQQITSDLIQIQDMQFGRLDPFDQPESSKIGVVHYKTVLAQTDQYGNVLTPYFWVDKGAVSEEPVYLTAAEERNRYIAEWNETFLNEDGSKKERVYARYNGAIMTVDANAVTLKEYSNIQTMSPARLCIPFQNHSAGKRILMGCNHPKQAAPTFGLSKPTVRTGGESILDYGNYTAQDITKMFFDTKRALVPALADYKDNIINAKISIESISSSNMSRTIDFKILGIDDILSKYFKSVDHFYSVSVPYLRNTPEKCMFSYRVNTQQKEFSGKDIVLYNIEYDINKADTEVLADYGGLKVDNDYKTGLSLGQNILIGFKTYESTTIDDSITISDELVYDDTLTSISLIQVEAELYSSSEYTENFGGGNGAKSYIGSDGLPHLGTVLKPSDVCISKIRTYLKDGKTEFKNVLLKSSEGGQVVSADTVTKNGKQMAVVLLAKRSDAEIGDKMAGRYGNKGVIAKIVPKTSMPYNPETGEYLQIILNPQGVPSRMNISQLLEVTLGLAMRRKKKDIVITPFYEGGDDYVREMAKSEDVHPARLIDGRTGLYFERPINYGVMYMYKMFHMVNKKIGSIGFDHPKDMVTLQPKKGLKNDGGQAFGEMEAWCLQGVGADILLEEMQTVSSDDIKHMNELQAYLSKNPYSIKMKDSYYELPETGVAAVETRNDNDKYYKVFLRSMGIELTTVSVNGKEGYAFSPMLDAQIRTLSHVPVGSDSALHKYNNLSTARKAAMRDSWGWIDIGAPIVLPIWLDKGNLSKMIICKKGDETKPITTDNLKAIIVGNAYVSIDNEGFVQYIGKDQYLSIVQYIGKDQYLSIVQYIGKDQYLSILDNAEDASDWLTGFEGLVYILEHYDIEKTLEYYQGKANKIGGKIVNKRNKIAEKEEKITGKDIRIEDLDCPGLEDQIVTELFSDSGVQDYQYVSLVDSFIKSGRKLSDYIVTAFPVMPAVYRPETMVSGRKGSSDFDWHYKQILFAVNSYKTSPSNAALLEVFYAIATFMGNDGAFNVKRVSKKQHKSIKTYFFGSKTSSKKDHGKVREAMLKKRLIRSGRSVITPSANVNLFPTEIGLPFLMAIKLFDIQIIAHLLNCYPNLKSKDKEFSNQLRHLIRAIAEGNEQRYLELYKNFANLFGTGKTPEEVKADLIKNITMFVEGTNGKPEGPGGIVIKPQVIICGRQPSLHKFSVRAYTPKIVFTKSIQIHHLVCKGYNADFDGDQIWVYAPIFDESKEEALRLLSVNAGVINPKNNSIILEHSQDIALGVYCATMLKNNAETLENTSCEQITSFSSLEEISNSIDVGTLHLYDLVCFKSESENYYISTAGRVLFNSLLPDGFTDEPFSNPLGIEGISKPERFKDLKYDGLITSGKSNSKNLKSFKLQDICEYMYDKYDVKVYGDTRYDSTIGVYQKILEFGFKYADLYGVSISIEDLENISRDLNKGPIILQADKLKSEIEEDYQNGLISYEDKKNCIAELYDGTNKLIGEKLIKGMDRNNNIFIMFDSGARGSKSQISQTCGTLGILQKSKTENLETSVTRNYYEGLSSFDLDQTSYSTRISIASTQNETQDAGHSTRQSVYMENGLTIVEKDCGKKDWWFDILWGEPKEDKFLFYPSNNFFMQNLLGKEVWDSQSVERLEDTLEGNVITASSYGILSEGFNEIIVSDKEKDVQSVSITDSKADLSHLRGCKVISIDKDLEGVAVGEYIKDDVLKIFKENAPLNLQVQTFSTYSLLSLLSNCAFVDDGENYKKIEKFLTNDNKLKEMNTQIIYKNHIMELKSNIGTFRFRYYMSESCRSLLTGRVGRNMEYMDLYSDPEFTVNNAPIKIITDKTLDWIEDNGLKRVEARILLDCESGRGSKHGICACCYGLKFSNKKLPKVGENVGVEAAQAIGEPAAQLTMDLVHSGGAAGASISGGVALFNQLLKASQISKGEHDAVISRDSGYVKVKQIDSNISVAIIPFNPKSYTCMNCNMRGSCNARFDNNPDFRECNCLLEGKIKSNMLRFRDGEWIDAGEAVTEGYIHPNNIKCASDPFSMKELVRKKQMACFLNYYNIFSNNNISIMARHFEILARLQNETGVVVESDDPNFIVGNSYEISELKDNPNVVYYLAESKQSDVIERNSGALALASFEDVIGHVADYACKNYVSFDNSSIGKIVVGENIFKHQKKKLSVPSGDVSERKNTDESKKEFEPVFDLGTSDSKSIELTDLNFDDFTMDVVLYGVDGIVMKSNEPYKGCTVSLLDDTGAVITNTETDARGYFMFNDLEAKSYFVKIRISDSNSYLHDFTLSSDKPFYNMGTIALNEESLEYMDAFDDDTNNVLNYPETERDTDDFDDDVDFDSFDDDLIESAKSTEFTKSESVTVQGMNLF